MQEKSPYSNAVNCAVCHSPLLMPPLGATAGLCPGKCTTAATVSPAEHRDAGVVVSMVARGQTTLELEPETLVTWLTPVAPKPPKPQPVDYYIAPDGTQIPRYRDPASPTGVTWIPGVDIFQGGSDSAWGDRFRDPEPAAEEGLGYTVVKSDHVGPRPIPGIQE